MKNNNSTNRMFVYIFWGSLFFERSIWMIYLNSSGVSLLHISILQAMLNCAMFLFEVPSGIIADKFGNKKAITLGHTLIIVYLFTMLNPSNLYLLALGFICYGIGLAMISGADQTLIYNNLDKDQSTYYQRIIGKYNAIAIIALALSSFAGGFLQNISWKFVFIAGILGQLLALIVLFSVKERKILSEEGTKATKSSIIMEVKSFLKSKNSFKNLIITIALLQGTLSVIYMFGQVLFVEVGFSVSTIAIIFTVLSLFSAVASTYSYYFVNKFSEKKLIFWSLIISLVSFLAMSIQNMFIILSLFIIINVLFEIWDTTFNAVLHHSIPSNIRASLVSLANVICSFVMVVLSLAFGALSEYFSMVNIIIITGVSTLFVSLILFTIYAKQSENEKDNKNVA
ncbi:MFS transporter [Bacillus cereus group sp. MYBK14-1]|uniref:MFS transporter n=1 Tax=Bacillus cereus group sp. MYBK14-1 TaxID=3450682 RepID=UPI003F7B3523